MAQVWNGLTLGGRGAVVSSNIFDRFFPFHSTYQEYPITPNPNRMLNNETRHTESLHVLNEELSQIRLRETPPAGKTFDGPPLPPPGPPPYKTIGCPGCDYTARVMGVWSPYKLDRSHGWARVWYFGASCPSCKTPEGVAERPFSVISPLKP